MQVFSDLRHFVRGKVAPIFAAAPLAVLCLAGPARAADTSLDTRTAQVEMRITNSRTAEIQERFVFATPLANAGFEYLSEPCATVGPIKMGTGNGEPIAFAQQQSGPWALLVPLGATGAAASEFRVDFTVRLAGTEPRIPVVMPSRALQFGSSNGAVAMRVAFDPSATGSAIVVPQMSRDPQSGAWLGNFAGLPSFVRVRLAGDQAPPPCAAPAAVSGSTGSLPLWIGGFAGVLTVWVIFYMWWAERQEQPVRG
jgi:hypothetical protein